MSKAINKEERATATAVIVAEVKMLQNVAESDELAANYLIWPKWLSWARQTVRSHMSSSPTCTSTHAIVLSTKNLVNCYAWLSPRERILPNRFHRNHMFNIDYRITSPPSQVGGKKYISKESNHINISWYHLISFIFFNCVNKLNHRRGSQCSFLHLVAPSQGTNCEQMTLLAGTVLGVCAFLAFDTTRKDWSLFLFKPFSHLFPTALTTWKRSPHSEQVSPSVFPVFHCLLTQRLERSLLRALWFVVKLKETATHAQHTSQSASTLGTRHLEHRSKNGKIWKLWKLWKWCLFDSFDSFDSFYHRFCWLELKVYAVQCIFLTSDEPIFGC